SAEGFFGYSPEWVLENGLLDIATSPRQLADLLQLLEQVRGALGDAQRLAELQTGLGGRTFVFDGVRADGRKITVEMRLTLMWDEQERFEGVLGIGRDITQQRRAER